MLDVCPSVIHLTVVDVVMQIEGVHPIQGRTTHILWFFIYGTVSKLCIHFMSLLAMGVISGVRPPLFHVLLYPLCVTCCYSPSTTYFPLHTYLVPQ